MYRLLFANLLTRIDPEDAHRAAFALMRAAAATPVVGPAIRGVLRPVSVAERLRVSAFGVDFPSPLGLAAGFDKDARGVRAAAGVGFGYVEVGTVTARAQPGNERPRLIRLAADHAIVNRMGFNNAGAARAGARLRRDLGRRDRDRPIPVGVNIGKTKVVDETDREAVLEDYRQSAAQVADVADYLVVNVSSPNTPGLRSLQSVEELRPLLSAVRSELDLRSRVRVPLLVKIAPDLADADVDLVADLALELGLDGIVATNTTIGRDGLVSDPREVERAGAGGLSGGPVRRRSLQVLRRLRARVGDRLTLVSVGGLETVDDAWERITAGATLLQSYTGFVYGGPWWPRRIQVGLARRLVAEGFTDLATAVGSGVNR